MSTVSKAAGRPTTNTDSKTPSPPTMITAGSTPTSLELNDTKAGMTGTIHIVVLTILHLLYYPLNPLTRLFRP